MWCKTGDELEALADQFIEMGSRLQESYADLEGKVALRTRELAQSVEELRALGEVSHAVNSALDVAAVLSTIVAQAVHLSDNPARGNFGDGDDERQVRPPGRHGMATGLAQDTAHP